MGRAALCNLSGAPGCVSSEAAARALSGLFSYERRFCTKRNFFSVALGNNRQGAFVLSRRDCLAGATTLDFRHLPRWLVAERHRRKHPTHWYDFQRGAIPFLTWARRRKIVTGIISNARTERILPMLDLCGPLRLYRLRCRECSAMGTSTSAPSTPGGCESQRRALGCRRPRFMDAPWAEVLEAPSARATRA